MWRSVSSRCTWCLHPPPLQCSHNLYCCCRISDHTMRALSTATITFNSEINICFVNLIAVHISLFLHFSPLLRFCVEHITLAQLLRKKWLHAVWLAASMCWTPYKCHPTCRTLKCSKLLSTIVLGHGLMSIFHCTLFWGSQFPLLCPSDHLSVGQPPAQPRVARVHMGCVFSSVVIEPSSTCGSHNTQEFELLTISF